MNIKLACIKLLPLAAVGQLVLTLNFCVPKANRQPAGTEVPWKLQAVFSWVSLKIS